MKNTISAIFILIAFANLTGCDNKPEPTKPTVNQSECEKSHSSDECFRSGTFTKSEPKSW